MKPQLPVWWLHPALLFTAVMGGLAAAAAMIPDNLYVDLWSTPKFFDASTEALTVFCIAAFALGATLPGLHLRGWNGARGTQLDAELSASTLLMLYRVATGLALFGYAVWIAIALSNGMNWQVVMDVVRSKPGAAYLVRSKYLVSAAGITTCTQFGVASAVLGSLLAARTGWRKIWKSLSLLFALGIARAVLNTERLAVLELIVPMVPVIVTLVLGRQASRSGRVRRVIAWAPLAGISALFFVFAGFEYGRSWTTYYSGGSVSFWTFAVSRLAGYYVTALNNGAYLVTRLNAPMGVPFFTLNFLWRFPFLSGLTHLLFPTFDLADTYFDLLNSGANAEFNNGGGLLAPAIDFGVYGMILYWLMIGLITGWVYRNFKRGSAWGLCLYPMLFLGTLEVPRGLYLSGGRAVPPICFLLLSAFLLRIKQRRAEGANVPTTPLPVVADLQVAIE
ncbi:MAG TPA: O-antigen polymerase [Bryobacteraceae bacterium]